MALFVLQSRFVNLSISCATLFTYDDPMFTPFIDALRNFKANIPTLQSFVMSSLGGNIYAILWTLSGGHTWAEQIKVPGASGNLQIKVNNTEFFDFKAVFWARPVRDAAAQLISALNVTAITATLL